MAKTTESAHDLVAAALESAGTVNGGKLSLVDHGLLAMPPDVAELMRAEIFGPRPAAQVGRAMQALAKRYGFEDGKTTSWMATVQAMRRERR